MTKKSLSASVFGIGLLLCSTPLNTGTVHATPSACVFETNATVMTLLGDCVTDTTLQIPDGFTMDLAGFTVVAVDPSGGHFLGAVIANAGAWAAVENGTVTTSNLTNTCDGGGPPDTRLRGVMFDGAAGHIRDMSIDNINQGASGCQEGNAIEVRNAPFDGTHPNTLKVEVWGNVLVNWQKTGIVANGDVDVWIHHNVINSSATQANLAANSLQAGFGGKILAEHNHIAGNSWSGPSDYASASILLYLSAPGTIVRQNVMMDGNSDVGIYIYADGVTVDNNKVFESGTDTNQFGYDIGVGNWGTGNVVTNNKSKGYSTPYDGVVDGKNKAIPSPSNQ